MAFVINHLGDNGTEVIARCDGCDEIISRTFIPLADVEIQGGPGNILLCNKCVDGRASKARLN